MGSEVSYEQQADTHHHSMVLYDKSRFGFYLDIGGGLKIEWYRDKIFSDTDIHASNLYPLLFDVNNERLMYMEKDYPIPKAIPRLDNKQDEIVVTAIITKEVFYCKYKAKLIYYSGSQWVTINMKTELCY